MQGPKSWRDSLHALTTHQIVLKPAVSLNGHDTYLVDAEMSDHNDGPRQEQILRELAANGDIIAQEFLHEVQSQGELSLVFFQKKFSHCIRKLPRPGEFRVQVEYGGLRQMYQPAEAIIEQAEEILSHINEPLLFARVDGVERDGGLILMELEVIDPMLFLAYDERAVERFVDAILSCL